MTSVSEGSPQASRRPALLLALLAGAALIAGFSMLNGIDPFDEGLMLQAARRIVSGQVPYRDFLWAYGPAEPYLLAGLFKLFGTSLLQWRIVLVAADAGVAVTAWLLVRGRAPRWLALTAWLAVACEIAEPRSSDPAPLALLASLLALLVVTDACCGMRRAAGAGLLVALAAALRIDFALYGFTAAAVAIAAPAPRARVRQTVVFCTVAIGVTALVYLPFALADGPGSLYTALIGNSLKTRDYWTLPFPLRFQAPPGAGLAKTLKKAIDFYVPLLSLIGYALLVAATGMRWLRTRRAPARELGLVVIGAGLAAYMTSRADANHAQPLFVTVVTGLALVAGRLGVLRRASGRGAAAALGMAILGLLTLHGFANRLSALLRPPAAVTLNVAVADGVQAPPAEARAIKRMVALVDANTTPRQPIYVLPKRSDLVVFSDPLIYVLTQRDNPTSEDFGLLSGAAAQARIVATLAHVRPRVLVRWTDPLSDTPEPNLRGRATGVHTLDDWVAAHYRVLARLYHYTVLIRDGLAARTG